MSDIFIESAYALVLLGLTIFVWHSGRRGAGDTYRGWGYIQAGFGLLLFASILDITDNFPALAQYIVIGDTTTEAFLEKIVGYLGGFGILGIGLIKCVPTNQRLSGEIAVHSEALKQQEELAEWYSMAAQTAKLGHWHFDEVKDEYIKISKEYAKIFGYSVDEFMDRYKTLEDDMSLVHPDDVQQVLEAYEIDQEKTELDYRIIRADGEIRHVREISKHIFDASGNIVEAMGTLQDVSELKEAQFVAEQATRAKSEFLSRMSHELRTPMNAVLGFTQLLAVDASLDETQQKYLRHVSDAGEHLLSLIDEILDLERVEAGKTGLVMESVDLGAVMLDCEQLTQSLAEKHQILLKNRVSANNACLVWADRMRLKQVLINLVSNAIKYNHAGGQVEMSCEDGVNGQICIRVQDNGFGISDKDMTELFEPFSRLGAEQSSIEGTGIGLTITKKLVELMGGELGVESVPGAGSTFSVYLRANSEQPRPAT